MTTRAYGLEAIGADGAIVAEASAGAGVGEASTLEGELAAGDGASDCSSSMLGRGVIDGDGLHAESTTDSMATAAMTTADWRIRDTS